MAGAGSHVEVLDGGGNVLGVGDKLLLIQLALGLLLDSRDEAADTGSDLAEGEDEGG